MINKVVSVLVNDLLDIMQTYDIKLSSAYTPELPGLSKFSRQFYSGTLGFSPGGMNGSKYQNKLLYRIGTPVPNEAAPSQKRLAVSTSLGEVGQEFEMDWESNLNLVKVRTSTDEGDILVRDVSLFSVPVEFMVLTEDIDLLLEILMMFHQKLKFISGLDVPLNLNNSETDVPNLKYFIRWQEDSPEVDYANFDNSSALNTLTLSLNIEGAYFSRFYREDKVFNTFDLNIGIT